MWEMDPLPWSGYRLLVLREPSQVQLHSTSPHHICNAVDFSISKICSAMQLICARPPGKSAGGQQCWHLSH